MQTKERLSVPLSQQSGFKNEKLFQTIQQNAIDNCGAKWFTRAATSFTKEIFVTCKSANELKGYLSDTNLDKINIVLTEKEYFFTDPLQVLNTAVISSKNNQPIKFIFQSDTQPFLFLLNAGSNLTFKNINLNLSEIKSSSFITTDTSAASNHSNFKMDNCIIENNNSTFFYAAKSSVCDSIIINKTTFKNSKGSIFNLAQETDKKGYYPVEKININNCIFQNNDEEILHLLRTGNDESTMGPQLFFSNNQIISCTNTFSAAALINLHGVQKSFIQNNVFNKSNAEGNLVRYIDEVRATHILKDNNFILSGTLQKNKYVIE